MTQDDLITLLEERFACRTILPEEDEQAAKIEQICFPPNEACTEKMMCGKNPSSSRCCFWLRLIGKPER